MNKQEKRIKFNQENILNAASLLFSEKGLSNTTMDDIAKKSEYSKSTIYVYFKSKEDIFNHIIYRNMNLLKEVSENCTKNSKSFIDGFYLYCNELVKLYNESPLYFEGIFNEIPVDDEILKKDEILLKIYNLGEEINSISEKFILKGIENKELRPDIVPIQTSFILWSSIGGIIILTQKKELYIKKSMGLTPDEFLKYSFDTLLNSILINNLGDTLC